MEEIFKDIAGYEGHYMVSNLGNVISLKYNKVRKMKLRLDQHGYPTICLWKDGKSTFPKVHRLVYEAFVGPRGDSMTINHIDYDRANNNVNNLESVTYRENSSHRALRENKSSKYLGVDYKRGVCKWVSRITFEGKRYHLGIFKTEIEAFEARMKFEKENNIINKYFSNFTEIYENDSTRIR
jgi:hypothetical protein